MILTRVHLEYFKARQRLPGWTKPLAEKSRVPSIDEVINANAGQPRPTNNDLQIHNTMSLARSYQRQGTLRNSLLAVSLFPGTVINPRKRAALAKKWLKRLGAAA